MENNRLKARQFYPGPEVEALLIEHLYTRGKKQNLSELLRKLLLWYLPNPEKADKIMAGDDSTD